MNSFPEALEASKNAPVVVLFTSPTCGPCRTMKPVLKGLAESLQFPYAELSITENMEMAKSLNVRAVPTMFTLRGGQITGAFTGGRSEAQIREILDEEQVTQRGLEF